MSSTSSCGGGGWFDGTSTWGFSLGGMAGTLAGRATGVHDPPRRGGQRRRRMVRRPTPALRAASVAVTFTEAVTFRRSRSARRIVLPVLFETRSRSLALLPAASERVTLRSLRLTLP